MVRSDNVGEGVKRRAACIYSRNADKRELLLEPWESLTDFNSLFDNLGKDGFDMFFFRLIFPLSCLFSAPADYGTNVICICKSFCLTNGSYICHNCTLIALCYLLCFIYFYSSAEFSKASCYPIILCTFHYYFSFFWLIFWLMIMIVHNLVLITFFCAWTLAMMRVSSFYLFSTVCQPNRIGLSFNIPPVSALLNQREFRKDLPS